MINKRMQGILIGRHEYSNFQLHVGMLIGQISDQYSFWPKFFCFPQKMWTVEPTFTLDQALGGLRLSKSHQQGWIWNAHIATAPEKNHHG